MGLSDIIDHAKDWPRETWLKSGFAGLAACLFLVAIGLVPWVSVVAGLIVFAAVIVRLHGADHGYDVALGVAKLPEGHDEEVVQEEATRTATATAEPVASSAGSAPDAAPLTLPASFPAARDDAPDDLKRIKGIGEKLEGVLNGLGVHHFDQIARMTDEDIGWLDNHLEGFTGRAVRDDWVGQARQLTAAVSSDSKV